VYDNANLYLQIIYLKELNKIENNETKYVGIEQINYLKELGKTKTDKIKYAGIDLGTRSLMAIFVDDETTPSLLVDGKSFKDYNKMINKIITCLRESKSKEVLECEISKIGEKCLVKYTEKVMEIDKFISFLDSKRNNLFNDQSCKMAKYVVKYLHLHEVTDLFMSKNMANHKFIRIQFKELLEQIDQEAQEHGIRVHYIDERYTSLVSCITGDIKSVQKNPKLANAYNGKRKDETFLDTVINKEFNADLNAAVNHIKVGTDKDFEWLKDKLFKLREPNIIKVNIDTDVMDIITGLCKIILI